MDDDDDADAEVLIMFFSDGVVPPRPSVVSRRRAGRKSETNLRLVRTIMDCL